MGKKKDQEVDAIADFFGDDVDWLRDDDDSVELPDNDMVTGEVLPVAPPVVLASDETASAPPSPPTPAPVPRAVEVIPAPRAAAPAPPALDSPEPTTTLPDPEATVTDASVAQVDHAENTDALLARAVDPAGVTDAYGSEVADPEPLGADPPTLEIDPTSEERSSRRALQHLPSAPPEPHLDTEELGWRDPDSEAIAIDGDALEAEGQEPDPLVHTGEPPPKRRETPMEDGVVHFSAPVFTPKTRPTGAPTSVPGDEAAEWRRAASALISEAAVASPDERGRLLFWSARLYRRRLGDEHGAAALLQDAFASGFKDPLLLRERARASIALENWDAAESAFVAHARSLRGTPRAESLQDAAGMASQRGDMEAACAFLLEAVEEDPSDYIALSLLRDHLKDVPGRLAVLERLAVLSPDALAAESLWEKGVQHRAIGEEGAARDAWLGALERWPVHAPALLSLRASYLEGGDHHERAALYEREANRAGQTDPGWWFLKAARAWQDAGQEGRARAMFTTAAALGDPLARREQQAFQWEQGKYAGYADSLREEISREKGAKARAFAAWRLGTVLEQHLDDPRGALAAYRQATELDAAAEPARAAIDRLLDSTEGTAELLDRWQAQIDEMTSPEARSLRLGRLAEVAEVRGELERARDAWKAVLHLFPDDRLALDCLARVCARLGDREMERHAYSEQALYAENAVSRAAWTFLSVVDLPADEAAVNEAGKADPGNLIYLQARLRTLVADRPALAELLEQSAAHVQAASHKARLLYQAARLLLDDGGDTSIVRALLERSLSHEVLPLARDLASELDVSSGASRERFLACQQQALDASDAQRAAWWWVAAAAVAATVEGEDAGTCLRHVLDEEPAHPGALAAWELHCLVRGDRAGLARAWNTAAQVDTQVRLRAARLGWVADLLQESGDVQGAGKALHELTTVHATGAPLRGAARLAAAQHDWDTATTLLRRAGQPEDLFERARILGHYQGQVEAAMQGYRELLDGPVAPAAALGLLQLGRAQDDSEAQLQGHRVLAQYGGHAFRAAHHAWSADILEVRRDEPGAREAHRQVLDRRPDSRTTFDALRRLAVAQGDEAGLVQLWLEVHPEDFRGRAEDLESIGSLKAAAEAWKQAVANAPESLPLLLELEHIQGRLGDWEGVCQTVSRIGELARDPSVQEQALARRRWVLAEKLAGTDLAWETYKDLHEQRPDDREVTEALAHIAASRGEHHLAVGYLEELAEGLESADALARYKRRIAALLATAGEGGNAREAWLEVLDAEPTDRAALDALQQLAQQDGDWSAVVVALNRLIAAGLGEGAYHKQLALVSEQHLGIAGAERVALHRQAAAVLRTPEAYMQVIELAREAEAWADYAWAGEALADLRSGPERGELLREAAFVAERELGQDPGWLLEQAIQASGDLEAARRLAQIYDERKDWAGKVRALRAQAGHPLPDEERGTLLAEAARIEANVHHERDVALELYREVLQLLPGHADALSYVADALVDQGRTTEALAIYRRLEPSLASRDTPEDLDGRMELAARWYQYATLLQRNGEADEALVRLTRALGVNPNHLASLQAAAPLYAASGELEAAEAAYRQLLQLTGGLGERPQVAASYAALGDVELRLGKLDKAAKRFNKALELQPNNVLALQGIARIFAAREDWDACMKAYNNVIFHGTERDDVVDAYLQKGSMLDEHLGRPDKAAEHYRRALEVAPQSGPAYLRLAELALREGDWLAAEADAHRGLKVALLPGAVRGDLLVAWALASLRKGDAEAARSAVEEARVVHPALADVLSKEALDEPDGVLEGLRARLRSG